MSSIYQQIRTKNLPGLGRQKLLDSILNQLRQGEHVSVVGPRFTGKSCLMRSLVVQEALRDQFQCIAMCDLRHAVIESNDDFYAVILEQLRADTHPSAAEWRDYAQPPPGISAWNTLHDLLKGMQSESAKVLVVLDGLDETAVSTSVDVNAWNNFTRLIDLGGAQFVCTSRKRLGDLDHDPRSRGSLFFQRFQDPLHIQRVDSDELDSWLGEAAAHFDAGAKTELLGQSGGHPQLLGLLLRTLSPVKNPLQAADIQDAAKQVLDDGSPDLWAVINEMTPEWQECLSCIENGGSVSAENTRALRARFAIRHENAKCSSRLMSAAVRHKSPSDATLKTLFGTEADYHQNLAATLKLRLAQFGSSSCHLQRHARNIVNNLAQPDFAIMEARNVLREALEIIYHAEIADRPFPRFEMDRSFPKAWQEGNDHNNLWVVDCLTYDKSGVKSQKVCRPIWVLLDCLYNAGNFSNHRLKQQATSSFALTVAVTAVELVFEMKRCGLI